MNKDEFLGALRDKLSVLPNEEIEKSVSFYDEMIADRMEDGMTEQEAVADLGDLDGIVKNIQLDMPITTLMKVKVNHSKTKMNNQALWLILVIVGSPVWVPLALAFAGVVFSIYIAIWSIIVACYATIVGLGAGCIGGLISGFAIAFTEAVPFGVATIGMALICGSLAVFATQPMIFVTKQLAKVTVLFIKKVKSLFITRNEVA